MLRSGEKNTVFVALPGGKFDARTVVPGPEGGDAGGEVIAQGTPEDVAEDEQSYTGHFLKRMFSEESALEKALHHGDSVVAG